ncbi:hypothetical protein SAMN03097699_1775 [Flavobacteriaceae bacterium MAR_2010_188]|nr:hypothetical protein SAMN03097699_1775 [Flavobacteriaceae bacterium MAR_2010_188]
MFGVTTVALICSQDSKQNITRVNSDGHERSELALAIFQISTYQIRRDLF